MPVKKEEKEYNHLVIKFGYGASVVLPYKEGNELMAFLEKAEDYDVSDYKTPKIKEYDSDISVKIISHKAYMDAKANALLLPDEEK